MLRSHLRVKKAITVTGRGGSQSCEMLRIPHCVDNRILDGGKVVSRVPLSRNIIFLLLVFISVKY
jgi:hypothetical protein